MTTLPGNWNDSDAIALIRSHCSPQDVNALMGFSGADFSTTKSIDGLATIAVVVNVIGDGLKRINRSVCARHLIQRESDDAPIAAGASRAVVAVNIARDKTLLGQAITLPKSYFRVTSVDGHVYRLTADVPFAAGFTGPVQLPFEAIHEGPSSTLDNSFMIDGIEEVAFGAQGDLGTVTVVSATEVHIVRGAGDYFLQSFTGAYLVFVAGSNGLKLARIVEVAADGTSARIESDDVLVGEVGTAGWTLLEWEQLGFSVEQPNPSTRGTLDTLAALGRESSRDRQDGEDDDMLREAILNLPDVVSINAIKRAVDRTLSAHGLAACRIYEMTALAGTADPSLGFERFPGIVADQTACDVHPEREAGTAPAGLWIVGPDAPAYFLVRIDGIENRGDTGGHSEADHLGFTVDPPPGSGASFPRSMAADISPCDGAAFGAAAIRRSVAATINKIKGAGVRWSFYPRKFYSL